MIKTYDVMYLDEGDVYVDRVQAANRWSAQHMVREDRGEEIELVACEVVTLPSPPVTRWQQRAAEIDAECRWPSGSRVDVGWHVY